jgi:hypothetical protein
VIRLSRESGQLLAAEPIEAQPSGVLPMHDPDGWVGLDVGEGQDGCRAWWVCSAGLADFEVLAAGRRDWIFADVDQSGSHVRTLPHDGSGPLVVRAFPSLEVIRSIDPPPGRFWGLCALFVGDMIVSTFRDEREGSRYRRMRAAAPAGQAAGAFRARMNATRNWRRSSGSGFSTSRAVSVTPAACNSDTT